VALKFYNAYRETTTNASDMWKDEFQALADVEFENSPDYYIIQKQDSNGIYQDLGVRLVAPYQIGASSTLKDDFKVIIHKRFDTVLNLGDMYSFGGNFHLTIDTGRNKSSSASCQVWRCGDFCRWFDDNGIYHNVPAVVTKVGIYDLNEDSYTMLPDNQLKILVPYTEETKLIKWADVNSADSKYTRFILQQYAYRVTSIDRHSYVRNNVGYIELRLQSDQLREADDLINNIADASSNNIAIDILNGNSTLTIGQTLQLNTLVTKNAIAIDNPTVTYISATPTVASVNSSGLVSALLAGTTNITATYGTVSDSVLISATPVVANNYTIDFSSNTGYIDYIKLGQSITYTVDAKVNGVSYPDTVVFSLTDDTGLASTDKASITAFTGTTCTVKCNNVSGNIGQYVRLYAVGSDKTDYVRLLIKSLF